MKKHLSLINMWLRVIIQHAKGKLEEIQLFPQYGPDTSHANGYKKNSCTDSSANRVVSDSGFLHGSEVGEYNWKQGWITGGIDSWTDTNGNNKLDVGEVIYWHTLSNDGKRRWNHCGTLQQADPDRPNHS